MAAAVVGARICGRSGGNGNGGGGGGHGGGHGGGVMAENTQMIKKIVLLRLP